MPHAAGWRSGCSSTSAGSRSSRSDADPDAPVWDASRYVASAFFAGIVVAMMVLPMACAVMREVFSKPRSGRGRRRSRSAPPSGA